MNEISIFEIILKVLIYKAANIVDNSASNRTVVVLIHPGILNQPTGATACMLIGLLCHIFNRECNSARWKFHWVIGQAKLPLHYNLRSDRSHKKQKETTTSVWRTETKMNRRWIMGWNFFWNWGRFEDKKDHGMKLLLKLRQI